MPLRLMRSCLLPLLMIALLHPGIVAAQPKPSEILIQHAEVYDGSGKPPFPADVRVEADRILAVAPNLKPRAGETVIDGKGLAVAPGFIDMHSHAAGGIFKDPTADVVIRQGGTT